MQYEKELTILRQAIGEAYASHGSAEKHTRDKGVFDTVTDIDLAVERDIARAVRAYFPADTVLGEEFSADAPVQGRVWSIDPIDGTWNFANDMPLYGVQCALIEDGIPVAAIVYLPRGSKWLMAQKGQGCYCNGARVRVASAVLPQHAIVSFGDLSHANERYFSVQHAAMGALAPRFGRLRMFGAACIDFSFVALGRTHATALLTKNVWDLAPGILLCREAGGVVTDIRGNAFRFGADGVIAAANAELAHMLADEFRGL